MATQIIQHKSRDFNVTLNFSDTENNLTWSFTPENDGEIYDIELDNVDSYQIGRSPVTLPFNVTAGTSYPVSIVKETAGVVASITFKTRRGINKNVNLNVPDFGDHVGEFTYTLVDGNKLVKYDNSKFTPANFTDFNTFIDDPKMSVITLPTVDAVVRGLKFVVINNEEYILCIGAVNYNSGATPMGERGFIAILVKVSDNSMMSIIGEANKWSFYPSDVRSISGYGVTYNYIENYVFYTTFSGSDGIKIELNTGNYEFLTGTRLNLFNYETTRDGCGFDPVEGIYAAMEAIFDENRQFSVLPAGAGVSGCKFSIDYLLWQRNFTQINHFRFYSTFGGSEVSIDTANLNSRNVIQVHLEGSYIIALGGGTGQKMFSVLDTNTNSGYSHTISEATGITFNCACGSNEYGTVIASTLDVVYNSNRQADQDEIILINPSNQSSPVFGRYVGGEGNIRNIVSNKL